MPYNSCVETIESKGWRLYDIGGDYQAGETWEERAMRNPASTIEEGGMYIFVPQPEPEQTLREAYAVTKGVGPHLKIRDPDSSEYKLLGLRFSPRFAAFTRLVVSRTAELGLFTPPTAELPESDFVVLAAETAEATFNRDFGIISPEDFKREVKYTVSEFHVEKI